MLKGNAATTFDNKLKMIQREAAATATDKQKSEADRLSLPPSDPQINRTKKMSRRNVITGSNSSHLMMCCLISFCCILTITTTSQVSQAAISKPNTSTNARSEQVIKPLQEQISTRNNTTGHLKPLPSQPEAIAVNINRTSDRHRSHTKRQIQTGADELSLSADQLHHHDEPLALSLESQEAGGERATNGAGGASLRGKRTLYACEEKQLAIECQLGESIQLIRANYGRFSIQICNEHGQLDWKVNCMSADSFEIIARSCQAKQSCQLLASNSIFGDACPGTQKYLEVHYQCLPATATAANRTFNDQQQQQQQLKGGGGGNANQIRLPTPIMTQASGSSSRTTSNNVIQTQQQQQQHYEAGSTPSGINSETIVKRPQWPTGNSNVQSAAAQLPNWMLDAGLPTNLGAVPSAPSPTSVSLAAAAAAASTTVSSTSLVTPLVSPATPPSGPPCPEIVWRQMRWPATEAGHLAQVACPGGVGGGALMANNVPYQAAASATATLLCQANGHWASRIQAARCQSGWLRNLTQRLEAGDSPLSILNELAHRTSQTTQQQQQQAMGASGALWAREAVDAGVSLQPVGLYGSDLVQISRIIGRLVDEMVELLNGIGDDKQRVSFAREMIQLLVEVINNLSSEQQVEAWNDLTKVNGERQRVAGQLVASLESGCVLLAGALQQSTPSSAGRQNQVNELDSTTTTTIDFHKSSEFVYVAIQSFALQLGDTADSLLMSPNGTSKFQVTFPSQASALGTKWMNSEQRFTLNLQASQADNEPAPAGQQQLKVVFVMLRNLGAQMEPREQTASQSFEGHEHQRLTTIVNSDLVSFSIVADSRRSLKVDLSAPIELVFRHNSQPAQRASSNCVYWDTSSSDWLSDGCKLVGANRTHSVCACNHLTTFGLLSSFDANELTNGLQLDQQQQQQHQQTRPVRFQIETGEPGEQIGSVHLGKLLDGNLLASDQTSRLALYLSCILGALMLALLLAAAAYNRAHARRLLGSMPSEPPPSLLVAHNNNNNLLGQNYQFAGVAPNGTQHTAAQMLGDMSQNPFGATARQHQQQQANVDGNSPSQPTSYSSDMNSNLSGQSGNLILQKQQLDFGSSPGAPVANNFYSLVASEQALGFVSKSLPSTALSSSNSGGGGSSSSSSSNRKRQHETVALVPLHLIAKLFSLQLLLLLMIESQNLLQQNAQQARRTMLMMLGQQQSFAMMDVEPSLQQQQQQRSQVILDPIGPITWLVTFLFFYLASSLLFWLLAQLMRLNGHLARRRLGDGGAQTFANNIPPVTPGVYQQTVQTINGLGQSNGIYQQQNRYGQVCQMHNNNNNGSVAGPQQQPLVPHSGSSPTLSTFSSSLANELMPSALDHQRRQQLLSPANNQKNAVDSLYGLQTYNNNNNNNSNKTSYASQVKYGRADTLNGVKWPRCAMQLAASGHLSWTLIHLGPLAFACLLTWLARNQAQWVNQRAYTSAYTSQLAFWPLLLDATSGLPTSTAIVNLFCLPSFCLGLGILALCLLRRAHVQRLHPTGSLAYGCTNEQLANSRVSQLHPTTTTQAQAQGEQNKTTNLADGQYASARAIEAALETKSARLACLTLLALLVLNSICWLAFFVHCHQSLASYSNSNLSNGNGLILTFAGSNLLLACLICCSQRRALRRAAQLAGWSRLLLAAASGPVTRNSTHQTGPTTTTLKQTPSPGSTNNSQMACDDRPNAYYTNGLAQHQHQHQQQQQYGKLQQQQQQAKLTSSPSQHSLFVISRSRPTVAAYGQQQQHYSQEAFQQQQHMMIAQQQQQQQHLYQQLALSQQHIYDSTTNLHSVGQSDGRQLNALHLMQQQQPMVDYGRHQQQHLFDHQFQQQQHMTLRPQQQHMFARNTHDLLTSGGGGMCAAGVHAKTLSASSRHQNHNQQQQQQSGEADGPLVALATNNTTVVQAAAAQNISSSAGQQQPSTTFGPNAHNNPASFQHQQAAATELRPSSNLQQAREADFQVAAATTAAAAANQRPAVMMMNRTQNMSGPVGQLASKTTAATTTTTTIRQQNQYGDSELTNEQQQQQQPMHFRRANSSTRQPNGSFASAAMMIDAPQAQQQQQQQQLQRRRRRLSEPMDNSDQDHDDHDDHETNIYDVANCVP